MISFSKRAAKINLGSRLGQIVFQKLHQNLWGKSCVAIQMQLYRLHLRLAIRIQEVVISVAQEPNRIETDDDNNNDHNSMIFGKTKQEQCQKMIF